MLTILSLLFAANLSTSSITATIRGTDQAVELVLLQRDANDTWQQIATHRLAPAQRRAAFDGIAAGVYQIRAIGPDPGELIAAKVVVGAGEKRSVDLAVDPIEVFGRATLGDVPLAGAAVALQNHELQSQVALTADNDGLFHARLWQRGAFLFVVRSAALATPYSDRVEIGGPPPFRWDLRLPDRRIAGVVRDRVSGAAIAGATLHIDAKSGETTRHLNAQAGNDGRFDFAAMHAGRITIEADAEGYLEGASSPFELGESERVQEVAVALEPGVVVPLTIVDAANQPLAGALVLTAVDGKLRAHATTNADGRARATLPRGAAATLYAIPRDGSFAIVHVAKAEDVPRRVTLPRPSSSLRIVTRTTDGKALPNVALLMRVNGELVPPDVAEILADEQGLDLRTDERGEALLRKLPAGSYEFWPYANASEAQAIVDTAANLLAPIAVNVKTGENSIAVNFRTR